MSPTPPPLASSLRCRVGLVLWRPFVNNPPAIESEDPTKRHMQREGEARIRSGPARLLLCDNNPTPPRSPLPRRDAQHRPSVLHLVRDQFASATQRGGGLQRSEPSGTHSQSGEPMLVRNEGGDLPVGVGERVAAQRSFRRGGSGPGTRRILPAGRTRGNGAAALGDGVPNRRRRLADSRWPGGDLPPQRRCARRSVAGPATTSSEQRRQQKQRTAPSPRGASPARGATSPHSPGGCRTT
jgi:hypothetical protein